MPAPIDIRPDSPEVDLPAAQPISVPVKPRKFYILRRDLRNHGYTAGCPACTAIQAKKDGLSKAEAEAKAKALEAEKEANEKRIAAAQPEEEVAEEAAEETTEAAAEETAAEAPAEEAPAAEEEAAKEE